MKINKKGLDLIKKYEGLRLTAYKCPAGVWTIGYGHTKGVKEGDKITEKEAENLLLKDLKIYEQGVTEYTDVILNQNQFSALVSFCFNCGIRAYKTSTMRKYINQKEFDLAANEFGKWIKAGGKVLKGLVKRRNEEKELFIQDG